MKATLRVNRSTCDRSALCTAMSAALFRFPENGRGAAEAVRTTLVEPDEIAMAQDVSACCPTQSVTLVVSMGESDDADL